MKAIRDSRRPPRQIVLSSTLAAILFVSGCTFSVVAIDDSAYKTAWTTGWEPVIQDQTPLIPSASSPGACNVGGNQAVCIKTDQNILSDFQALLEDLSNTRVPAEFSNANDAVKQGLKETIQGLTDRDAGISRDDTPLFQKAEGELKQSESLIYQGYNLFPAYDRPIPQPFDGKL